MFELILQMRPLIAICISMAAALLILLLGDRVKPNYREGMTFGAAIIKAACVFSMVPAVLAGETFDITLLEIVKGVDLAIKVDSLGMVFACVASGLWIVTSVYSVGYMRGHGEPDRIFCSLCDVSVRGHRYLFSCKPFYFLYFL